MIATPKDSLQPTPIEIDVMSPNDIEATAMVFMEVFQQAHEPEAWTLETAKKYVEYWYERQPDLCFVARAAGEIVGGIFAAIKPRPRGNHLYDTEIFVMPDHRKQKVGKKLYRQLVSTALEKYQIVKFEGLANKENEAVMAFFTSLGFEETNWVEVEVNPGVILEKLSQQITS